MNRRELSAIHRRSLATSTTITGYFLLDGIAPVRVLRVLNKAGLRSVLIGTHGIGGWMRKPRASPDVDILVGASAYRRAVKALRSSFPQLEAEEQGASTRLRNRKGSQFAIDVMKPDRPLLREALQRTFMPGGRGPSYQIPSVEMAVALRFEPVALLPGSEPDKYLYPHDFLVMVNVNRDIDLEELALLGELAYPGGGREITEQVRRIWAGEKFQFPEVC